MSDGRLIDFNGIPLGTIQNPVYISVGGSVVIDVTLQDQAVSVGNGTQFIVQVYKVVTFEVYGSSTSRTVQFEAQSVSGLWVPCRCINISSNTSATQTTVNLEVWQVDVTGLVSFRTRISSIAGGNISIKGKAVT